MFERAPILIPCYSAGSASPCGVTQAGTDRLSCAPRSTPRKGQTRYPSYTTNIGSLAREWQINRWQMYWATTQTESTLVFACCAFVSEACRLVPLAAGICAHETMARHDVADVASRPMPPCSVPCYWTWCFKKRSQAGPTSS